MLLTDAISAYALPVAALPLWVALFLDRRTAFMVGMAASFLCASLVDYRLDYLLTYLAAQLHHHARAARPAPTQATSCWQARPPRIASATLVIASTMLLAGRHLAAR